MYRLKDLLDRIEEIRTEYNQSLSELINAPWQEELTLPPTGLEILRRAAAVATSEAINNIVDASMFITFIGSIGIGKRGYGGVENVYHGGRQAAHGRPCEKMLNLEKFGN
jgi:hypothetical protein